MTWFRWLTIIIIIIIIVDFVKRHTRSNWATRTNFVRTRPALYEDGLKILASASRWPRGLNIPVPCLLVCWSFVFDDWTFTDGNSTSRTGVPLFTLEPESPKPGSGQGTHLYTSSTLDIHYSHVYQFSIIASNKPINLSLVRHIPLCLYDTSV